MYVHKYALKGLCNGRASVSPFVTSFARHTPLLRVCYCAPGRQEMSIGLHGRRSAAAAPQHGAQQQMRAVSRLQLT